MLYTFYLIVFIGIFNLVEFFVSEMSVRILSSTNNIPTELFKTAKTPLANCSTEFKVISERAT